MTVAGPRSEPLVVVRGAHLHTLDGAVARSLALAGERVLALGRGAGALDHLAAAGAAAVDLPGLCALPGLSDAHVHQVEATQDLDAVDVGAARSLAGLLEALRAAAGHAPPGAWVVTRRDWQETRLAERRLPTTAELDGLGLDRPVAVRRGNHLAVLNSHGLALAGAAPLERDERALPTGLLRGAGAITRLPARGGALPATTEARAAALERACALHASRGLTGARDAGVTREEQAVYEHLDAAGRLRVRTDLLVGVPRGLDAAGRLALLEDLGPPPAPRPGGHLRVNGIKLYLDGHVADAALRGRDPGEVTGRLEMDAADLAQVAARASDLGWRVGCHTVGDAALDVALDGYEQVLRARPDLPPGWLAVEHACLADEAQRHRTAALGAGVTVQHPLLHAYSAAMLEHWGPERTAAASPVRGWLDAGALVAAGSDGHVVPFDPLLSLWGLATRGTLDSGVQGPAQRLSLEQALRLYTVEQAWLSPWRLARRAFEPGSHADLVAFDRCLLEAPVADLAGGLDPVLTVLGGRATHDPHGLWPAPA